MSPEHPLDDNTVRALVAAQFPQWADLTVRRWPSSGTVNVLYRLGDDLVVRIPRSQGGAEDVVREQRWLPRLASLVPTTIPEVVGVGTASETYPWSWSVYRWLPGEPPRAGSLRAPAPLAEGLAEFVSAMRGVALPGAPTAHRGEAIANLDGATQRAIERLRGIPEEGVDCGAVAAVWREALRAEDHATSCVWLHADVIPGNLLVDAVGRLSAVIDFGCAGVGDPACDLFPAWNLLPPEARSVFREALNVDDATWARGRGRALSQAVIALPHYRDSNPTMADNARHVIRAVLDER